MNVLHTYTHIHAHAQPTSRTNTIKKKTTATIKRAHKNTILGTFVPRLQRQHRPPPHQDWQNSVTRRCPPHPSRPQRAVPPSDGDPTPSVPNGCEMWDWLDSRGDQRRSQDRTKDGIAEVMKTRAVAVREATKRATKRANKATAATTNGTDNANWRDESNEPLFFCANSRRTISRTFNSSRIYGSMR